MLDNQSLAMPRLSAGLLMYRKRNGRMEALLVHPGGPFWAKKDRGAWSIPKGEYKGSEKPLEAAQREFREETGFVAEGHFEHLGEVRQAGGRIVTAWAVEGDCDPDKLISNTCQIEWPPRSGRLLEFPEVDCGRWFSLHEAREHILKSQEPFLDRLSALSSAFEQG
jgi:predicted NUDIX family NTP pyrophosphohydrolase